MASRKHLNSGKSILLIVLLRHIVVISISSLRSIILHQEHSHGLLKNALLRLQLRSWKRSFGRMENQLRSSQTMAKNSDLKNFKLFSNDMAFSTIERLQVIHRPTTKWNGSTMN